MRLKFQPSSIGKIHLDLQTASSKPDSLLTIEPLQMRNQTSPKLVEDKREDNDDDKILFSIESSNPTTSSLKFLDITKPPKSSKLSNYNDSDDSYEDDSMSDDDDDEDDDHSINSK